MDWWRRRSRARSVPQDEHAERLATAAKYARHLTETGSRCHLNAGRSRFCRWEATELSAAATGDDGVPPVAVRCSTHPGGRYLDSTARLDPADFA
jgi:hypothetical protein